MAIRKTLLAIVKEVLSDMDSEDINTLSDTTEAGQIATIAESVFYNIIATRNIPEHNELIKLTALSDSNYPTHFTYPENVRVVTRIDYDKSDDGSFEYAEVKWVDNEDFLRRTDKISSDYVSVMDENAGTNLRIVNNKHPSFYTSFDDYHIVMDSFKSTVDSTLQESKSRALGVVYPVFMQVDSYIPDIDGDLFPYYIAEVKSMCFSLLKGGSDPKIEQAARRQKSYIQNDRYRTRKGASWNDYGRR